MLKIAIAIIFVTAVAVTVYTLCVGSARADREAEMRFKAGDLTKGEDK